MGLFKRKTLEEEYLEMIAKCDKRLVRDKTLLAKVVTNPLSRKMLENNITMMENTRAKFTRLLSEYRSQNNKSGEKEIMGKCEFCRDEIEREDLLEFNSKSYHTWCKQHVELEEKP